MEFYNRISIITNEIRLSELRNFRGLISGYFEDLTYGNFGGSPIEGETARELRPQINRKIARISSIVFYSGTSSSNQTLRPPIVGGGSYSVDILANLFYLGNHDIGRDADFDLLDRSIGIYEGDRLNAALRSLNPFWWIWKAVNWLSALPFKLIGQAGFNGKAIESSGPGRSFKLLIQILLFLITIGAAILEIDERVNGGRIADLISVGRAEP